jgi:hypothetical protein
VRIDPHAAHRILHPVLGRGVAMAMVVRVTVRTRGAAGRGAARFSVFVAMVVRV